MDRRPGRAPAVSLVVLLLGGFAPADASLLIDFDTSRVLWRNDGTPTIEGRNGGESRQLGSHGILAAPLAATGGLRFPLCRILPEAAREGCDDTLLPAGAPQLELDMPLPPELRQAYLPLWRMAKPPVPPEQVELAEAMGQVRRELSAAIQLRDLPRLLVPLQQAARQAEAAAVAPALVARARRSEAMVGVLADLWRIRNALSSRDLSLPCDTLEQKVVLFNEAAGEPAVRLHRQGPVGICLFCGNVCTPQSADRLLADMKQAVIRALGEEELSGSGAGS
jgi:hypothetical protein